MSNRITITLTLDIPEGLTPDVTYGNTPPVVQATLQALSDEPPFPTEELPAPQQLQTPVCQVHQKPMNFRPAGVSQRTGKAYKAFWSCPERDCNQKKDAA